MVYYDKKGFGPGAEGLFDYACPKILGEAQCPYER
jgi:hypothetical protein